MAVPTKVAGDGLILSPREALVAGGPAEEFESRIQELFKAGYRHLVTDLRGVTQIDSAGIRALVRGLTSAQRLQGSFKLVAPSPEVLAVLRVARLDAVFSVFDRLEPALAKRWPWRNIAVFVGGAVLIAVLAILGTWVAPVIPEEGRQWLTTGGGGAPASLPAWQPFVELGKLVLAAAIGVIVTAVHRRYRVERPQTQSMEQAQVLLCVSGAMMMVIIGSSLARAFGIAGAASIIRFRTPVEDPKDITVLFLLMGLGMAAGVGAFALAGVGAAFLCVTLVALERFGGRKPRIMTVELRATGRDFPIRHVESALARYGIVFEPREVSQGDESVVQYHTKLDPDTALEDVSQALMGDGTAGIQSVVWEVAKRKA